MDKIRLMDNPEARKLVMPSAGMEYPHAYCHT